uniref:Uncharacterized protein n=1 Tax=Microcystis aeruginosa (strain PCC 7806) TaxID=267872 RepID=A8YBQ3_MICA7|nr:unnamed protein product [Microcystis aeruginosa PCC 7806]
MRDKFIPVRPSPDRDKFERPSRPLYVREYNSVVPRDSSIQTRVLSYIPPIARLNLIIHDENHLTTPCVGT